MIKLLTFLLLAAIGFFVLPEVLAVIAGILFFAGFFPLILTGIGSFLSLLGSTLSTLLGVLLTLVSMVAISVIILIGLPVFLAVMIPLGFLILAGGLFYSLLCGII